MAKTLPRFELVIPAYNEAKNLPTLLQQSISAAQEFGHTPQSFGLVLVNNGSTDNSAAVIQKVLADKNWHDWVQVLSVPINQGYGHGIQQGLLHTRAPLVGWSHADLQCDPRNAFVALEKWRASPSAFTLVKGQRTGRAPQERWVSYVFACLARIILGHRLREINAQPKVFPRELLSSFTHPPKTFAFDLYALYQAQKQNYQILEIPVHFPPRQHGVSHWAAHFSGRYKTIWGIILYMVRLAKNEGRL